eukprot:3928726-Heterocapsa_arctica.AAC.1
MAYQTGQAWAKACYMAGVGYEGGSQEQPWATARAWTDGPSFMPDGTDAAYLHRDAGQDRPSRKEA